MPRGSKSYGRGTIGDPTSVQVSSTHLYHAVSLIRGLLGVAYEPATVNARAFVAPLVDPLTPDGWTHDAVPRPATTTLATIDFGGRMGLYDFTDNQWWNPLRTRRIVIRGSAGEIVDDTVIRLHDPTTPIASELSRRQTGIDLNLEGLDLKHISFDGDVVYRNPFVGSGMSDDDIAVAAIVEATGAWARGDAPPPYPLAQACQDHLIALAIEESTRTGADVTVAPRSVGRLTEPAGYPRWSRPRAAEAARIRPGGRRAWRAGTRRASTGNCAKRRSGATSTTCPAPANRCRTTARSTTPSGGSRDSYAGRASPRPVCRRRLHYVKRSRICRRCWPASAPRRPSGRS